MMRLEAVNSSSRIATTSGDSIVFFASSEGAKTDRVQRDVRSDRDLNRARGRNHADRQQTEQCKGVFHAAILPPPAQLSIPHEGDTEIPRLPRSAPAW